VQRRHRGKHQGCHHQPRREQRRKHGSHGTVKNHVHSLVAMEALEATSMAAEIDPDLILKIRARHCTRRRRGYKSSFGRDDVGASLRP
jgi:hypothetical protein